MTIISKENLNQLILQVKTKYPYRMENTIDVRLVFFDFLSFSGPLLNIQVENEIKYIG
jgi:hypothetical protein